MAAPAPAPVVIRPPLEPVVPEPVEALPDLPEAPRVKKSQVMVAVKGPAEPVRPAPVVSECVADEQWKRGQQAWLERVYGDIVARLAEEPDGVEHLSRVKAQQRVWMQQIDSVAPGGRLLAGAARHRGVGVGRAEVIRREAR